jgi:hypothetical protein
LDPLAEEYCALTVTFCTSGRVNKAFMILVAQLCRLPAFCVAAVFDSASAVESNAA